MHSIISLRSNITRRKANITEAHFVRKCASLAVPFCLDFFYIMDAGDGTQFF